MTSPPTLLSRVWPTAVAVAAMLLACIFYFSPQLSGKEVPSADLVSHRGMVHELVEYEAETGRRALWTNSMFGGMPAYQIYAPERGNLLRYVERVLRVGLDRPIGYFFIIMLGLFVLLRVLGVGVWLSLAGAVTFGLSANHMTLFEAGHMTKLRAISFMAPTLAGLVLLFRGRWLTGLAVFALALGLNVHANHPQMTYYLAAACGCFVVFRLIRDAGAGQLARFGKALAFSLLAAGLAVGASYSKLSTTVEYGKDTMRGAPILEASAKTGAAPTSSSEVQGLEWNYAMQWSNGLIDVMASFVPGAAGGNSAVEIDRDGPIATAVRRQGAQLPPGTRLPLYHGDLPFTSGPAYFGAVAVYLFILAMFFLPAGWRYFFGSAVLLTFAISMGKNMEWLNRLLFDTVPYFNNFRAPSSATSVTTMLVAAGGFAGLCQVLRLSPAERAASLQKFYIGTGLAAGLLLIMAFLGPSLSDLAGGSDQRLVDSGLPLDALVEERAAMLRGSALRTLGFVLAAAAAVWAYLRGNIGALVAVAVVGVLSVADVWTVARDYIDADSFQPSRQVAAQFTPRSVDEQILRDTDPHYRVLDLTVNTFNDSKVSYFHKTVGGYHAAKLQRIQDLIDRYISQASEPVLNMLNTKYLIVGQPGQERAQVNAGALGNAWFVRRVEAVPNANAEIDALATLDPATTAVVHEEFADALPGRTFSGAGSIRLTEYAPDRLTYASQSDAEQLAVFSEMWYGPDKGWKVTIDGAPAELIRVNYALRGLVVPAGQHEIEMYFEPDKFYRGEVVSYAASGLILLLAIAALFFGLRQNPPSTTAEDDALPPHAGAPAAA